ncbi:MAG: glycine zipper domain-containing protein [Candidatus Omnitrophota bacterium]
MQKILAFLLSICFMAMTGCESVGENTQRGAVGGGLIGAAAGGVIGHQSGETGEGAAIGSAVGALGGALIGRRIDRKQSAVNSDHVSINSIIEMSQAGTADALIIDRIKDTNSKYPLTAEVIEYLRENGVSDRVINHMLDTAQE